MIPGRRPLRGCEHRAVLLSGPPSVTLAVPTAVARLAGVAELEPVWVNELGGITWRCGEGARFVKWAPAGSSLDLAAEAVRLSWAAAFTPVPRVLEEGRDDGGAWLLTAAVPGESAVHPRWLRDPATAVTAIGEGLRALHDSLPVGECPFDWSAAVQLSEARQRAAAGLLHPSTWQPAHIALSVPEVLARLADVPDADRLVVCHGDACSPNTLIDEDGRWSGHVDLGRLGTADRWADLAVATMSTEWNYGPGWERPLLEAYGVEPDPLRTAYYRLLWDAGP
jgi:kanamycin kinase